MKFIVFDMDGVLVETSRCHARAFSDLWRQCGIVGPAYREIAGQSTREVVERYTRSLAATSPTIDEWVTFKQQRAREYLRSEPVVFGEVLPCLKALGGAGIGMAVATGASRPTAEMLLDRAGIAQFFQFILTAEDVRNGKPHPEIYQTAVANSGASPDQTLVVEDSTSGLEAAVAASIPVACVRSGLIIGSPYFVGSYSDLLEFTRAVGVLV